MVSGLSTEGADVKVLGLAVAADGLFTFDVERNADFLLVTGLSECLVSVDSPCGLAIIEFCWCLVGVLSNSVLSLAAEDATHREGWLHVAGWKGHGVASIWHGVSTFVALDTCLHGVFGQAQTLQFSKLECCNLLVHPGFGPLQSLCLGFDYVITHDMIFS